MKNETNCRLKKQERKVGRRGCVEWVCRRKKMLKGENFSIQYC